MHVVPAGVRHRRGLAIRACRSNHAGIRKTGRFLDGQRIHIRPQHYGWAVSVAQYTDNPRLADSCRDLEAAFPQMVRRNGCSARFLHRQFGMSVNVLVNRLQLREQFIQWSKHLSWLLSIGHLGLLCWCPTA